MLLVQARSNLTQGAQSLVLDVVRQVLRQGELNTHIRGFLDAGWPIAALLTQLHERGGLNQQGEHVRMAAYLKRIVDLRAAEAPARDQR